MTDDDLEAALAINLRAPHILTAELVPSMIAQGRGNIIMIGSWMAHSGFAFVGMYSATKAAQIQLARSWSAEFGPHGIRVNAVSPGVTRASEDELDPVAASMVAHSPAQRSGRPQEVAKAVAWLLSDNAEYVQGSEIRVDGGISSTRFN